MFRCRGFVWKIRFYTRSGGLLGLFLPFILLTCTSSWFNISQCNLFVKGGKSSELQHMYSNVNLRRFCSIQENALSLFITDRRELCDNANNASRTCKVQTTTILYVRSDMRDFPSSSSGDADLLQLRRVDALVEHGRLLHLTTLSTSRPLRTLPWGAVPCAVLRAHGRCFPIHTRQCHSDSTLVPKQKYSPFIITAILAQRT
jgi:hypothetical protein